MKNLIFILVLVCSSLATQAQNHKLNKLNNYKFVYLMPLIYEGGKEDMYGITKMVKNRLEKSGLQVIIGNGPVQSNPDIQNCDLLSCDVSHQDLNSSYLTKKDSVTIRFINCLDEIVVQLSAPTKGVNSNAQSKLQDATTTALKAFEGYYYRNVRGEKYETMKPNATQSLLPSFPGGLKRLEDFIHSNIQYPKGAKKEGISGSVDLAFTIDKRGFVKEVAVKQGLREDLDNEAKRIVTALPRWIAGMDNGKPADKRTVYTVTFSAKRPNADKVDY